MQAVSRRGFEAEVFVAFPCFVYFRLSKNPQKEVNYQFNVVVLKMELPMRLKMYFFTVEIRSEIQPGESGLLANMASSCVRGG